MNAVSFSYSFDHILKATRKSLKKKGFKITGINSAMSEIIAKKKFRIFQPDMLHITILSKEEEPDVHLKLVAKSNNPFQLEDNFIEELYRHL